MWSMVFFLYEADSLVFIHLVGLGGQYLYFLSNSPLGFQIGNLSWGVKRVDSKVHPIGEGDNPMWRYIPSCART